MIYFKQATASQEFPIGPLIDDTDFVSGATGLTIANTDIKFWFAGATALTSKNSGGATEIATGNYYAVADATDTANLGGGKIIVQVSGALAWWDYFAIIDANTYNALFGGSVLDVNASKIGGTTQTGRDIGASVLLSAGSGTGQLDFTSGVVKANVTQNAGSNITSASGVQEVKVQSIANNAITANSIASDAITAAKVADGAIDAGAIADGAITAAKIATGAIDADALAADAGTEIAAAVLTAAASTPVEANIKKINDVTITGSGTNGDEFQP